MSVQDLIVFNLKLKCYFVTIQNNRYSVLVKAALASERKPVLFCNETNTFGITLFYV